MVKNLNFIFVFIAMLLCKFSYAQYADPYTGNPANYTFSTPVGTTQNIDIPGGNGITGTLAISPNSIEWTFNFPDNILNVGTPILPPGFYVYSTNTNGYDVFIKVRNNITIPAPTASVTQNFIFSFPVTGTLAAVQGTILSNVRVLPGFNGTVGNNSISNDNGSNIIIFSAALPTADADEAVTPEDVAVTIPVLTNDTFGYDGPSTGTITITDQPSNGTATVNNGGTPNNPADDQVVYTPNPNFNGIDTLIYQICDANNDCDTAMVIVNITPVNDLPVANADNATTPEDSPVTIPVLTNDNFGGDGPSTGAITITDQPSNGTATVNNGGTPNNPADDQVVYTPNPNFNGIDTLIYQICDANNDCDTAMVIVNITPVNDLPVANADNATTPEDSPVTIPVLTNDNFGGDGPSTGSITITDQPSNGTVTVNNGGTPNNPADDQVVYTPNPNFNGIDTLIYQICDFNNDCDTAMVIVNITPVNDLPVANTDNATTPEDSPVTIPVLTNDNFGGDGPSTGAITITDQPSNGTATVNNGGTPNNPADDQVVYTPNPNFNGIDTLIYQICDANNDCDTAMVIVNITPVNDLPVANTNTTTTPEDVAVTVPVLTNDNFGGDGPSTGAITITDQPSNGTATVNNGGTPNNPADDQVVYTPNPNFNGIDTLIYQICDANNDCDTAMVIVNITPVNDPPIVPDTIVTTPEDTPIVVCIPFTDVDLTDIHNVVIGCNPGNGTVTNGPAVVGNTVCLTYSPNQNFNGTDSLCIVVCDNNGACDTGKIVIEITPVNDLPLANTDSVLTLADLPVTVPVLLNDTFGGDGPSTGTITITDQPSNGTATVNNGGTPNNPADDQIVYTPNTNFTGIDTLIYQVCDANNDCDTAFVIIKVNPHPDLTPVIDLPFANFAVNETKNFVVYLEEVNGAATDTGVTVWRVNVPIGFELGAYNATLTNITPSGGAPQAVSNNEFTVVSQTATTITLQAKQNVFIDRYGVKYFGFSVTRTTSISQSTGNITSGIFNDPTKAYDSYVPNNTYSRIINAQ